MFFGSFSWSFVYVSLPFHIQKISTLDEVSTLRWTGWILGISPLATVVTAPPGWDGSAGVEIPKTAFEIIQYLQGRRSSPWRWPARCPRSSSPDWWWD